MADKVPIRTVFDGSGNATGLAEYQSGESVGFIHGGTGLTTIGTSGQILRVNGSANALEYTSTILTPDGTITLDSSGDIILDADGADIILKDAGTEFGRFTNSSGQLVIKSSSSTTTAISMSGANVTIAGNLTVTGNTEGDGNITIGDAATDTVSFGGTITSNLVFEGSTGDSFETTLAPGNPSADITLTLPATATDTLAGIASTQTLSNKTLTTPIITEIDSGSSITLDATTDIVLDAGGADVTLKDDGTTFGSLSQSGGELVIKSGSSSTTAITMAGANVTIAGNLTVSGTTTTVDSSTVNITTGFVFEGATSDSFETTLTASDPTADRTLTLPDVTGTVISTGNLSEITSVGVLTGANPLVFEGSTADAHETTLAVGNPGSDITLTLPSSASDTLVGRATTDTLTNKTITSPTVSGLTLSDSSIIFEGSTADSFETTLTVTDPTADRTITLPNATGTLISHGMFSGDATVATSGALTLATVNSNVGQAGSATAIPVVTVNAKGLVTAVSTASITTTLTVGADSGSNDTVSLATDTLDFSGGSNITTTVSNNDISIALDASPTVTSLIFEGSTADSFETTLAVTDPTADRTLTFPNRSGTVAITSDTAFPQSTLVEHPAASGNHDAGAVTAATTDAFGALIGDLFDNMEPRGSTGTVDLGSVA
jgi:formylmethanofuran dehydrogenase subunit C